jgi:hypothetical protein
VIAAHFGTSALMTLYRFTQHRLISAEHGASIEQDLKDGRHEGALQRLGLSPLADRLGALERLPYLSPAIADTRLGASCAATAAAEPALAAAISRLMR